MPKPNPTNVLDLRQLSAAKQAPPRRSWRVRRRPASPAPATISLSRPTLYVRDWVVFRREFAKFWLTLSLVGLLGLAVVGVSNIASQRSAVERQARSGLTAFTDGLAALGRSDTTSAGGHFTTASEDFTHARARLSRVAGLPLAFWRKVPYVGHRLQTADDLLRSGGDLARIGQHLSTLIPADALSQPAVTVTSDGIVQGSIGVLSSLLEQRTAFLSDLNQLAKTIGVLQNLPSKDLPGDLGRQLALWQRLSSGLFGSEQSLDQLVNFLIGLFAPTTPREYLVVFQNNDELRPTGGFPGTFLLVQFQQGTFKILDAPGNGPYALADALSKDVLPPQPILAVAKFWTFHDANWFLDVPNSSAQLLQFYATDRGFTPDGVIWLTPGIMEDVLKITGPIRPEHYQIDITAENFVAATEQQVEFGYDKVKNNPKQFLIDLVPLMISKLSQLPGPQAVQAIAMIMQRATQQDLLFNSRDSELQTAIQNLGWDGRLLPLNGDGLAVVDTNLGGGKTDREIDEHVDVSVRLEGSTLQHEVSVRRTHRGTAGDQFNGQTNRTFVRIYAPANAQFTNITGMSIPEPGMFLEPDVAAKMSAGLLQLEGQTLYDESNGIRITHESGRMVFGAWSRIDPGQSQTLTFRYTTPAPNNGQAATWDFLWQHQPGAPLRTWDVTFTVPKGRKVQIVGGSGHVEGNHRTATLSTDSRLNRQITVNYQ